MGLRRRELRLTSGVQRLGAVAGLNAGGLAAFDNFTDADAVRLQSHAMNVGRGWTENGGSQWQVTSNRAQWVGGTGTNVTVTTDAGISDATVSLAWPVFGSLAYVVFRYVDDNNYWIAGYNGTFNCFEVNGGVFTQRGTSAYGTPQSADVISVVLAGTSIAVKMNGVQQFAVTSASFQTATKFGLFVSGSDATTRFDDFRVSR
jgi:hypothetical protein